MAKKNNPTPRGPFGYDGPTSKPSTPKPKRTVEVLADLSRRLRAQGSLDGVKLAIEAEVYVRLWLFTKLKHRGVMEEHAAMLVKMMEAELKGGQ